jgi:hypothetical protein
VAILAYFNMARDHKNAVRVLEETNTAIVEHVTEISCERAPTEEDDYLFMVA